jgi:hypothetical protein
MRPILLLTVTALVEAPTGLLLWPALVVALLLGPRQPQPESLVIARVAGAGVLGIGVACWAARRDMRSPAQLGVLAAVLIYGVVVAAVLVFAAVAVRMVGIVLWPAIVFHVAMAVWCGVCSRATGER